MRCGVRGSIIPRSTGVLPRPRTAGAGDAHIEGGSRRGAVLSPAIAATCASNSGVAARVQSSRSNHERRSVMGDLHPASPVAVGYETRPAAGSGPGVLVLHAWWGLNGVFRAVCDRLAAAGFVAVAPDLWGGVVATTVEEAESLLAEADTDALLAAVSAGLAHLRSHPAVQGTHLGAIGFSMGAAWA